VPWAVRFQIILFFVRLHLCSDLKGMESLKKDIKALQKSLPSPASGGAVGPAPTSMPYDVSKVIAKLDAMSYEAHCKKSRLDPATVRIPLSGGPIYNGF